MYSWTIALLSLFCLCFATLQYLKKHQDNLQGVSREHFSFSPRMPVGDFYEERETPEVCIQSFVCATDVGWVKILRVFHSKMNICVMSSQVFSA